MYNVEATSLRKFPKPLHLNMPITQHLNLRRLVCLRRHISYAFRSKTSQLTSVAFLTPSAVILPFCAFTPFEEAASVKRLRAL